MASNGQFERDVVIGTLAVVVTCTLHAARWTLRQDGGVPVSHRHQAYDL